MKTKIKSFLVLTLFALAAGCAAFLPKDADPLAGWQKDYGKVNQSIVNDYQNYIQKLPAKERNSQGPLIFFKDGTGQHAIDIVIGINGRYWRHILIYDKDNKRIKTIKYATGYYES